MPKWRQDKESMQSCGVITLLPRPGAVPRLAGNPGANVEMRFPRCHSAHECEHRGSSGQCAGSISSVASSHSFGDNLADCRLDEPGRDPLSRTVTLSIIGHRICVQLQVTNHIRTRVLQLL